MARRTVVDLSTDRTIELELNKEVSGYYIGYKITQGPYGDGKLHVMQGEDGTFGFWAGKQGDAKLATVPKGSMTFITFTTPSVVKNGKKTPKGYCVEWDDELSITVDEAVITRSKEPPETEEEGEEAAAEGEEAADVDQDEPEATEEEAPPVLQAAPLKKGAPTAVNDAAKARATAILQKVRAAATTKTAKTA